MRLIDADKLKQMYLELVNDEEVNNVRKLECLEAMRQIDSQPTAYGKYVCDGCKHEPVHPEKSPCRSCGRTMVDYYVRGGVDD